MVLRRPSGFIEPCQPSKVARPPSGPLWVHEIKHDGYRLMVRRDGSRVRCFTRSGHDWADRFRAILEAAARLKAQSFLINGEAMIARDDRTPGQHVGPKGNINPTPVEAVFPEPGGWATTSRGQFLAAGVDR